MTACLNKSNVLVYHVYLSEIIVSLSVFMSIDELVHIVHIDKCIVCSIEF